jgi:hypothetical protein
LGDQGEEAAVLGGDAGLPDHGAAAAVEGGAFGADGGAGDAGARNRRA